MMKESNKASGSSENDAVIEAAQKGDLSFFSGSSDALSSNSSSSPSQHYQEAAAANAIRRARCKAGCSALHWAAGSGHVTLVRFLLDGNFFSEDVDRNKNNNAANLTVTAKMALGRTPLHYACRNGHLPVVRCLIEDYHATPNVRAKQGVTPLQLAVWQNHGPVCRYLVETCGIVPALDVNDFGCGLVHWLGIVPWHRVCEEEEDGEEENGEENETTSPDENNNTADQNKTTSPPPTSILPLAQWLLHQPNMDIHARQNQGHTILHKAAWGGHFQLIQYLHEHYHFYDDQTDQAGNYAADLADMANTARHDKIARYLRRECSWERCQSLKILGLTATNATGTTTATTTTTTPTTEEIRRAYLAKAKMLHPDRQQQQQPQENGIGPRNDDGGGDDKNQNNNSKNTDKQPYSFDELRRAYEFLTVGQGVATQQRNPAHSIHLLLEMQQQNSQKQNDHDSASDKASKQQDNSTEEEDNLFQARLLAVLLEYGDKGLDLSNIAKKWNQVWPDIPLSSYYDKDDKNGGDPKKRGQLLQLIKRRAGSSVRIVRKADGNNKHGAILVVPKHISRKDVLDYDRQQQQQQQNDESPSLSIQ